MLEASQQRRAPMQIADITVNHAEARHNGGLVSGYQKIEVAHGGLG
jgi:hypothetical protein